MWPSPQVRFIIPAVLLFNVAAAAGLARLHQSRGKGRRRRLAWLAALGLVGVSIAATLLMALASRHNYPGGHALERLHRIVEDRPQVGTWSI